MAEDRRIQMADFPVAPRPDYGTTTMAAMWQHQQHGYFIDLQVKVKDMTIPCHKLVLSAACEFFASLLTPESKEKKTNDEICLENIDSDVMMNIMRQDATFKLESLPNVLEAMEIMGLESIKEQVSKIMSDNLSAENCLAWWKLSSKYGMEGVSSKSMEIIVSDISIVGSCEEFKTLTVEQLLHIISVETVESTDELLVASIEWVDCEPLARKNNMADIMKMINLKKCSVETLNTIDKKYQDLLHDASVYRLIVNKLFERMLASKASAGKNETELMVVLGGMANNWNDKINNKCFVARSVDDIQWEAFAEIPVGAQAKRSPIVATNEGFIVFRGGHTQKKTTKYDAKNKSWHDLPDSPACVEDGSAMLCDNSVYLLGGVGSLASVYRLDLASLIWYQESDMLDEDLCPIAAALNKKIYAVHRKRLGMFDAATTKTWQQKSNLPEGVPDLIGSSLVASEDCLYLVGGMHRVAARYDEPIDAWTLLSQPRIHHLCGSAALYKGKIYLIGHFNADHSNASVYDIAKNQWSVVPVNLPFTQISFFTAAVVTWLSWRSYGLLDCHSKLDGIDMHASLTSIDLPSEQ